MCRIRMVVTRTKTNVPWRIFCAVLGLGTSSSSLSSHGVLSYSGFLPSNETQQPEHPSAAASVTRSKNGQATRPESLHDLKQLLVQCSTTARLKSLQPCSHLPAHSILATEQRLDTFAAWKAYFEKASFVETMRHARLNSGKDAPSCCYGGRMHPRISKFCASMRRKFELPVVLHPRGKGAFNRFLFAQVERGVGFSWVRIGDGELSCMAGGVRVIASWKCSQRMSAEMIAMLKLVRETNNFFVAVGSWWACESNHFAKILANAWGGSRRNRRAAGSGGFLVNGFYLEHARNDSTSGLTIGLVGAAKRSGRPVIIIGPRHLRKLSRAMYNYSGFVETGSGADFPQVLRAITDASTLVDQIRQSTASPQATILFLVACGGPAKVFIALAHKGKHYKNLEGHVYVDVGSSLDAFVGTSSRDYNSASGYKNHLCKKFKSF
eukprot:CAMPEP_0119336020 /NCGR_PEP_ID=MMETSP1333-20130426/90915_1 /TAXON_ID=418940 /ORGANISM="Scyphosphaera apsteinii, Strain RCC1455" /LENGTH=436 /DNA_ID=CAMNT_0007346723 /DNA_START=124 /DNA_END=1431 /DNA_ORIENTATION=+